MKSCPQCSSVYADDLSFCLHDGSTLETSGSQETIFLPKKSELVISRPTVKQGVSPIFAYLTVGLLALIIGGGIVALAWWIFGKNSMQEELIADNKSNLLQTNKTQALETTPTIKKIPVITAEVTRNLINDWENAQNTKNFEKYKDCYDVSFRGIKRTVKGSISTYNYTQWLADRRAMMKKTDTMRVSVEDLQVSIQNNEAIVEFKQYFYVKGYADFGPKFIKIKMTENGPKIIFEELKSATLVTD